MKIAVQHLLSQPEGAVENYSLEAENLTIDETQAQVTGQAVLTHLDDLILVQIKGEVQITQPCSRCLKEITLTIPLNFAKEFKEERSLHSGRDDRGEILKYREVGPGQSQDDEVMNALSVQDDGEAYLIVDGEIDLALPITEEIIANTPIRALCREDCQGLCPKCGANLNDNPCKCDKVEFEIFNKINL